MNLSKGVTKSAFAKAMADKKDPDGIVNDTSHPSGIVNDTSHGAGRAGRAGVPLRGRTCAFLPKNESFSRGKEL
jgi:hypothetical protein